MPINLPQNYRRASSGVISANNYDMIYSMKSLKKIANVITHLIQKENVLMIAQDAKIKNERYLCLNVNVDLQNMNLGD